MCKVKMCKDISLKWNLFFMIMFFICNVFIFMLFDYMENKPKPILFTIKFCLVFTFLFFIIMYVSSEPKYSSNFIINENPVIIVKPPDWAYTYNSLDEYLPDSLIREIMKFQFTEDPKYFNFEIYKQL